MSKLVIPKGYTTKLSMYETQRAIGALKRSFEDKLSNALQLSRVSCPLFVDPKTGLNDDLNGIERAVEFDILEMKTNAQIVHSLAKWKRMALYQYAFPIDQGLYTDMNAVRRDEEMDNLHSIYVDQWDWEKVIDLSSRNLTYLKGTVKQIVEAIVDTQVGMKKKYKALTTSLKKEVVFITTQELEDLYPSLTPKEREHEFVKEHKTVFILEIGDVLASGEKHDGRAPDYDDWKLNGDIVFWNETLQCAFEVSSMGIRVDATALDQQLSKANAEDRRQLPFHKMMLEGELPLTMGGGIGQSRLCMLILEKAHIGEVQVSIWDEATIEGCKSSHIQLL